MKMHSIVDSGRVTIPAFLNKLWKMVDDEKTNELISWGSSGDTFVIKHQGNFCNNLLPLFYKHSNMASFVRQLNIYDFHKVSHVESGLMKGDREQIEFMHPFFKRDEPELLGHIKRKITVKGASGEAEKKNIDLMNQVLQDVQNMRTRQISLNAQLTTMKQHNVALWRELSILRRKHQKQQQIVNKLIQFLVSMVHTSRNLSGLGVKRKYPLMINDISQSNKSGRVSADGPTIHELIEPVLEEGEVLPENDTPLIEIYSPDSRGCESELEIPQQLLTGTKRKSPTKSRNKSPKKPKPTLEKLNIDNETTELAKDPEEIATIVMSTPDAELLKQAASDYGFMLNADDEDSLEATPSQVPLSSLDLSILKKENVDHPEEESFDPIIISEDVDFQNIFPETPQPIVPEPGPSNTSIQSYNSRVPDAASNQDIDKHLDAMQSDLDSIKDMLVLEGYSIDANTLLGLFGCEDPMSYTLPMGDNEDLQDPGSDGIVNELDPMLSGNELMCTPNFDTYAPPPEPTTENNDLERIDNILDTLLASKDKQ